MSTPTTGEERIAALEKQVVQLSETVARLERWHTHAREDTRLIRAAIQSWPGPFTAREIHELVQRGGGTVSYVNVHHRLAHMVKRGLVEVVRPGAGPVPSQYEFLGGETGVRRKGVHLGHTSGLIIALRAALDHLPEVFTQKDVRAWVKEKRGKVPNGLYAYIDALIKSGEIEVVSKRTFGADAQPQRYRRKQVVSAATGQELSAAEQAWREFRKTVKVQPDTWEDAA